MELISSEITLPGSLVFRKFWDGRMQKLTKFKSKEAVEAGEEETVSR